jgi:hypothetical protein
MGLFVCLSVRHASTAALEKPYVQRKYRNLAETPERFAGSYEITLYIQYFEARFT